MRTYAVDSPQAAARILALMLVADRDITNAEVAWLDRLGVHEQLGLDRRELHDVFDGFCEDLLGSGQLDWADICPVDRGTLGGLLRDIQSPELRRTLLRLCRELALADERLSSGESVVLAAAAAHWRQDGKPVANARH